MENSAHLHRLFPVPCTPFPIPYSTVLLFNSLAALTYRVKESGTRSGISKGWTVHVQVFFRFPVKKMEFSGSQVECYHLPVVHVGRRRGLDNPFDTCAQRDVVWDLRSA